MFDICQPFIIDNNLKTITNQLSKQPPIIHAKDITILKKLIIKAQNNQATILQAGDCAEEFAKINKESTRNKQKQLITLAKQISKNNKKPTIIIGRIAGQFAKPRSATTNNTILNYHGDIIHSNNLNNRHPNPKRMLTAFQKSQEIFNTLKWPGKLIFTSHECLVLPYEISLTHNNLNTGAHLLWLGARSYDKEDIINYLSTINNPVAIKIASQTPINTMIKIIKKINQQNKDDKIILISRLGETACNILPKWLSATQSLPFKITWICDPMHANTKKDDYNKYRLIPDIIKEITSTKKLNPKLAGIHLEITPEHVEECLNNKVQYKRTYTSAVDPRLNTNQALEIIQYL
jgi:3-deoxy-7-phosphoheptulonate synthase